MAAPLQTPASRRAALAQSLLPIPLAVALAAALLLLNCGGPPTADAAGEADLQPLTTVRVHYPAGSHQLSIRGDGAALTWSKGTPLQGAGSDTWVFTTRALKGALQWKPLLDDATWSQGPNYAAKAGATVDVWPHFQHAQGAVQRIDNWWSNGLQNTRPIWVYTPPSYAEQPGLRYPVLYLQDGQNLFDPAWSFAGVTWRVAEAMDAGGADGSIREAIVIGVGNTANRIWEYTPSADPDYGGGGAASYLLFVTDELRPQIDRLYRTSGTRLDSGVGGSSLGGLFAAFAGLSRPDVFGLVAVISPSTWWNNDELIGKVAASGGAAVKPARVYVDSGDAGPSNDDVDQTRQLAQAYQALGGVQVQYTVGHGDTHTESSWARRLPGALRFLLGPRAALP